MIAEKVGSKWCVTFAGVTVTENSKKKALEEIEKVLEEQNKLLEGAGGPYLLTYEGQFALVHWGKFRGWVWDVGQLDSLPDHAEQSYWGVTSGDGTKEDTILRARRHLAQNVFEWWGETGEDLLAYVDDIEGLADLRSSLRWQYTYKFLRDVKGLSDFEARDNIYPTANLEEFKSWVKEGFGRIPWEEENGAV